MDVAAWYLLALRLKQSQSPIYSARRWLRAFHPLSPFWRFENRNMLRAKLRFHVPIVPEPTGGQVPRICRIPNTIQAVIAEPSTARVMRHSHRPSSFVNRRIKPKRHSPVASATQRNLRCLHVKVISDGHSTNYGTPPPLRSERKSYLKPRRLSWDMPQPTSLKFTQNGMLRRHEKLYARLVRYRALSYCPRT